MCTREAPLATAVDDGRLIIRNVGIAAHEGELEFWISDRSEWSSFSRDNATKQNTRAISNAVRTIRFGQLLEQQGMPHFLKVDIEGNDRLCLEGLAEFEGRPVVSVETSHEDGDVDINLLSDLGYRAFKCVRQNDFFEVLPENIERQLSVRRVLSRLGRAGGLLRRLGPGRPRIQGWSFPWGSSGPLPYELEGRWMSHEEVQVVWRRLQTSTANSRPRDLVSGSTYTPSSNPPATQDERPTSRRPRWRLSQPAYPRTVVSGVDPLRRTSTDWGVATGADAEMEKRTQRVRR